MNVKPDTQSCLSHSHGQAAASPAKPATPEPKKEEPAVVVKAAAAAVEEKKAEPAKPAAVPPPAAAKPATPAVTSAKPAAEPAGWNPVSHRSRRRVTGSQSALLACLLAEHELGWK